MWDLNRTCGYNRFTIHTFTMPLLVLTAIKDRMYRKWPTTISGGWPFWMISWLSISYHNQNLMAIFTNNSNKVVIIKDVKNLRYHLSRYSGCWWRYLLSIFTFDINWIFMISIWNLTFSGSYDNARCHWLGWCRLLADHLN